MIEYTFRELFSNINFDSVWEILPKINEYNREIAKFIEDINAKYGIVPNYTKLEISEIKHWAETFQVVANMCSQPEQQLLQIPQISVTVPSPQAPAPLLREQQEETNRLNYVAEQWLAEEPHRVQDNTTYYHTMGRNRSSCHCHTPNMSLVCPDTRKHRNYDSQGHNRYSNYDRRSQHYNRPEADHRTYSHTLPNTHNDSATVVINAVVFFSQTGISTIYT